MIKINYRERERKKAVKIRDSIFNDPGQGMFFGKEREFVLNDPSLNLWEGIRVDALDYFNENKIPWWKGEEFAPTGHLLSSQVACVNHLYYLRQRKDLTTAILKGIDNDIIEASSIEKGYVEFEFIGKKPYLNEKSWTRGANCTSVDAAMIGINQLGNNILFLIEWKYTEYYSKKDKYIEERSKVYDDLIADSNSPFKNTIKLEAFYYEPFYQLMRQTLLAWKLTENRDYGCFDYFHVHVIPNENEKLLQSKTSPYLSGNNITEAWRSTLKNPDKYITISPQDLLDPCSKETDSKSFLSYLERRYWNWGC